MCGIIGVYSFDGSFDKNIESIIKGMAKKITHRGPDANGFWKNEENTIALGHQRLSIIDISDNSAQPMISSDKNSIVFNGEIYNFRELRSKLKDVEFKSNGDTEVLLEYYRKMGKAFVDELTGMFAIAIWDNSKKRLLLIRDRIGKKPLYYSIQKGKIAFASEIKALLEVPWIEKRLNSEALYQFLTFGFVPGSKTMFDGIKKLMPGELLEIDESGNILLEKFWSPSAIEVSNQSKTLQRELKKRAEAVIKKRLVSDVPVGVFLSGGVDSGYISKVISDDNTNVTHSFSIRTETPTGEKDANLARGVARELGFDHHEKTVDSKDCEEVFLEIVKIFDDPLFDATNFGIYYLSEMAKKQNIKVVLSGDGPDELFFGYNKWITYKNIYPFFKFLSFLPHFVKFIFHKMTTFFFSRLQLEKISYKAILNQELFWGSDRGFHKREKTKILSEKFFEVLEETDENEIISQYREEFSKINYKDKSFTSWMCFLGSRFVVPQIFLHRADLLGMHHSIEIRTPYLDHSFFEYALSVFSKWKVQKWEGKFIFRKALEEFLPKTILNQEKIGFASDSQKWLEVPIFKVFDNDFLRINADLQLFNEDEVLKLLRACKGGNFQDFEKLCLLGFLIAWLDVWIVK